MLRIGSATLLLTLASWGALGAPPARALVIDPLWAGAFDLSVTQGSPFDSVSQSGLATLGGGREVLLSLNSGAGPARVTLDTLASLPSVSFTASSATTFTLRYAAASPGVDLSDGGLADRLSIDVPATEGSSSLLLRVDDDLGNVGIAPAAALSGPGSIVWPFSQLASVDMTRVVRVELSSFVSSVDVHASEYRNFRSAGPNAPPVAEAGPDQSEFIGSSVLLQGSASDADGDPITIWYWTIESSPLGSTALLSGEFSATAGLDADTPGVYVLALTAFDGTQWSAADTVSVIYSVNLPPVAVALASTTHGVVPLAVQFDGTTSFDPEGFPLLHLWEFGDGSPPTLDPYPLHVFESPGTFRSELKVEDDLRQVDYGVLWITVLPQQLSHDAADAGRYDAAGDHDPLDTEYQATVDGSRSFFVFDLSDLDVPEPIVSATLELDVGGVTQGAFGGVDYTLHEVTTSLAIVTAGGSGLTGVYQDLGDGLLYSAPQTIAPVDQGTTTLIPLLPEGIAALNAAKGDSLVIGGSPSGLSGNFAFDGTDVAGARLLIEFGAAAPIPLLSRPTTVVLIVGLAGVGVAMFRRRVCSREPV